MPETTPDKPASPNLFTTAPEAAAEARAQAVEYDSVFSPITLTLDDGEVIEIPPHPNLRILDDDILAAYEELIFEAESYDRGPEIYIPEQKAKDRAGNEITLPSETRPGALLVPYRKNGKLISPPHTVRVVQVVLGEQDYARLRAGKIDGRRGSAGEVWRIWNEQSQRLLDRQRADSKSDGGGVDLAPVPAPDRR